MLSVAFSSAGQASAAARLAPFFAGASAAKATEVSMANPAANASVRIFMSLVNVRERRGLQRTAARSTRDRTRTCKTPCKDKTSGALTHKETHTPAQMGAELGEVVSAWAHLPGPLRAAVLTAVRAT